MNTGLISIRYATALLEYAIGLEQQETVYDEVRLLLQSYFEVDDFRDALANPVIGREQKRQLIHTASGGEVSQALERFIDLLLKNKREERLLYIALRFVELYREQYGIIPGTLVTASKMEKNAYDRLQAFIEERTGGTLELKREIDTSILGGFVLQVGDYRMDASVSAQLARIKEQLDEINK